MDVSKQQNNSIKQTLEKNVSNTIDKHKDKDYNKHIR
jgi:hypothetical protein